MYHTKLNAAEEPAARPRNILKILYEHTHTRTHASTHTPLITTTPLLVSYSPPPEMQV